MPSNFLSHKALRDFTCNRAIKGCAYVGLVLLMDCLSVVAQVLNFAIKQQLMQGCHRTALYRTTSGIAKMA